MAAKPKPAPKKPFPGAAPPFKPKKPKGAGAMGGKPVTHTPADRRLAENKPPKPAKPKPSKP